VNKVGSVPKIEILDESGATLESFTGHRVAEKLWPVWAWATHGGTFPAGHYTCRVSVDGRVELTRPFTVGI
jgi:hypothetical protein